MRLSVIEARLCAEDLLVGERADIDINIGRVVFDSRDVRPGDCFVAIRGAQSDGHLFIDKAVYNGAIAIVCEAVPVHSREGFSGIAVVHVSDTRQALLSISSLINGEPGKHMTLIGVTGTNGKTTVATLVQHILEFNGVPCGFLGTTGYGYRDVMYQASTTTPSPVALYQLLAEMKSAGVDACSMEVSSHALDQSRVRVHDFNVAIFTNLTRDHLDYHESADAYFAAKKRLFDGLPETATAVVNADDPFGTKIAKDTDARIVSFGTRNDADIRYEILEDGAAGLKMRIEDLTGSFKLSGRFNAENIAAAYSAGLSLGFSAENVINALTTARPAKGRFEAFTSANARVVIIDYAHTPDALRNVLAEARRRTNGKSALWCVFGCGGDRDTGKRPLMGAIAEELADHVVITNDNPRSEDPKLILNDIRAGMNHPDLATWCPDRRDAIRFVEAQSHAEDVVVIAGKGHETRQIIGHVSQEFDDSIEACAAFGIKNSGGGNEAVVTI